MKARKIVEIIIFYLFVIWILFGIFSVFYNSNKLISEVKEWGFITEENKKHKLFGDYYSLYIFLRDNSSSQQIHLYTTDPMAFFLPRYFLYPQRIFWIRNQNEFESKLQQAKDSKFFIYENKVNLEKYIVVATFSATQNKKGYLIK